MKVTRELGAAAVAVVLAGCGGGTAALSHSSPPVRVTVTHTVTAPGKAVTITPKPKVSMVTATPAAAPAPTQAAPAPAPTQAPNSGLSDPVAVVTQFYADITAHDYGSDQVSAYISAVETDGSVRDYHGTYTVRNGVIVGANITPG